MPVNVRIDRNCEDIIEDILGRERNRGQEIDGGPLLFIRADQRGTGNQIIGEKEG